MIKRIRQLFCRHDFQPHTKNTKYQILSGETIYYICVKCGKSNGSVFREYNDQGNGFK